METETQQECVCVIESMRQPEKLTLNINILNTISKLLLMAQTGMNNKLLH